MATLDFTPQYGYAIPLRFSTVWGYSSQAGTNENYNNAKYNDTCANIANDINNAIATCRTSSYNNRNSGKNSAIKI
uniref:Uncharacterized protein n=1 Tax=Glossina palpalis gambiensis TaxID=67801 RepID=A0A1B0AZP6_9MUSC